MWSPSLRGWWSWSSWSRSSPLVSEVVVVVVRSVGPAISVVDTGTLVVNVVEVPRGVMTNGARPLSVLGGGRGVPSVVSMVGAGLVQSSGTARWRAWCGQQHRAQTARAATVAAVVRYQGLIALFAMSRHGRRSLAGASASGLLTTDGTSDQVRAILGGACAYLGRSGVSAAWRRLRRTRSDQRAVGELDSYRAGRLAQGGQVDLGQCAGGESIAPHRRHGGHPHRRGSRTGRHKPVTAVHYGGARSNDADHPGPRRRTGLRPGRDQPADIADLEVRWPDAELADTTIVDTPGTSSLSRDVSARTLWLVPDDGVPRVDAVVFLLRTLPPIGLLKQIGELGSAVGALGVIGVASHADEIGAGRIDAMLSANDVAFRAGDEQDRDLSGRGARRRTAR